jgi:hypothetical protein
VERTVIIIVASLALFLTACASNKGRGGLNLKPAIMPEWAKTGEHPDYPENEYLVVYGLARTTTEAREIAASRLEAVICDHATSPHTTMFKDTHFEQIVTRPAGWFALSEFDTAVRTDLASNGFEAVSMHAISRNELKLRARSLLPAATQALSDAEEPPAGLGTIQKRLEMWGAYYLLAVRVVALELLATDTLNRTAFDKVERALLALWELPALVKTDLGGNDQYMRIHGGAPEKLTLKASFRGQPVTGVPIAWEPGIGFRGVVEGDKELDATGVARGEVMYMASTGDDFGYAQASIDIDKVVGRRTGIAMNVWLWRVLLPCRKNGELVVRVTETCNGDQPLEQPVFTPEIKKWAEGRLLGFSENEPNAVKYHYHLLVEGQVDVTPMTRDEVPSAYVSGTLTLSDMETGEVLYRYTIGLQREGAKGNSEASVMLLVGQEGAGEVMAEFASRIIAALPGPGDEFGR